MSNFLQLYVMCMHPVEKEKTEATNILYTGIMIHINNTEVIGIFSNIAGRILFTIFLIASSGSRQCVSSQTRILIMRGVMKSLVDSKPHHCYITCICT